MMRREVSEPNDLRHRGKLRVKEGMGVVSAWVSETPCPYLRWPCRSSSCQTSLRVFNQAGLSHSCPCLITDSAAAVFTGQSALIKLRGLLDETWQAALGRRINQTWHAALTSEGRRADEEILLKGLHLSCQSLVIQRAALAVHSECEQRSKVKQMHLSPEDLFECFRMIKRIVL